MIEIKCNGRDWVKVTDFRKTGVFLDWQNGILNIGKTGVFRVGKLEYLGLAKLEYLETSLGGLVYSSRCQRWVKVVCGMSDWVKVVG